MNIDNNLIVFGDLLLGGNGTLLCTGDTTFAFNEMTKEKFIETIGFPDGEYKAGDYDISDKQVIVKGDVYVLGGMKQSPDWEGSVIADYKEIAE